MNITDTLEERSNEALSLALRVANAVDYLGQILSVDPNAVKTSEKAEDILRFD